MDSFFKQRFPAGKCKTLLKLTIPRIKLLRNRREIQIKQMRREIAKLLETGQEATARIRVEHIIREEKMMAAQEIVELFCELIAVRLPIIESQRECPLDLKEAISSVCFAAPRCADLTELVQVQILFAGKYGKEFVSAATELMPECGVNRQLVELLSIRAPAADAKVKLLKEIAEEHKLDWDPTATENELLKPHEDLLNGPTHFTSGYKLPLPGEKHDESLQSSKSGPVTDDSDEDFDIVDYPEIPKHPVKSNKGNVSVPEMLPFPVSALSEDDNEEEPNPFGEQKNRSHLGSDNVVSGKPVMEEDASSKYTDARVEVKQFVPFMSPPSQSSLPLPVREYDSVPLAAKTRNDHVDLQDVLAAAQAAAESAERAAAAARSAASIAQLRIAELVKRKNDEVPTPTEGNPFHLPEMKELNKKISGDGDSASTSPSQNAVSGYYAAHQPAVSPSYYYDIQAADPSSTVNNVLSPSVDHHQPHRLPWMEDETHFSYPNLFSSEGSNLSTRTQSFTDNK